MKRKTLPKVVFFLLGVAFMFAVSEAQVSGGTLTVAQEADVVDLDPHTTSAYSTTVVLDQIYDSLLALDSSGEVLPSLAESWEVSENGLTYTFTLRASLAFSNGDALTADDVVYSLNRILNPETASPRQNELGEVASVTAIDDRTVEIVLSEPFAPLLTKLAQPTMAILPENIAQEVDLRQNPLGAGPFQFVRWVPGESVILERNPNYWEAGKPYLDSLVFRPLGDESSRVNNLIAGSVDLILSVPLREVDRLSNMDGIDVVGGAGTWYDYLGMNLDAEPFSDVRVRRAIALALNRDQIVQTVLFGRGTAITCGPIPPSHWAASDCEAQYTDLEEARRLLEEAGYPDGFSMSIKAGSDYQSQVNIAQLAQAQLSQIGVQAQVETLEWGAFLDDVNNKRFDAVILGWIGAVDPDDFLYAQFHSGERWELLRLRQRRGGRPLGAGAQHLAPRRTSHRLPERAAAYRRRRPLCVFAHQRSVRGVIVRGSMVTNIMQLA